MVSLCIETCVPRLVFTSTSEVTLTPYLGSMYSIIVNQTERKAKPAVDESGKGLLIPGYPASKLRAEKIVLSANGTSFSDGELLKKKVPREITNYGAQVLREGL